MNAVFNDTVNPKTTSRSGHSHPASLDTGWKSILILTRSSDVSISIHRGLQLACRGCEIIRATCVETALKYGRERHFSVAFLGCDLPDTIFQQIQCGAAGTSVRIIGVREGGGTMQAIRLMSHQLISAYISVPAALATLRALSSSPVAPIATRAMTF